MLKQRVITALLLMAVLLPALFAPSPLPFALLTLVALGAAGWEWGRLNGASSTVALLLGAVLAALCAGSLWIGWDKMPPRLVWSMALVAWVAFGALAIRSGPSGWPKIPMPARQLIGLLALWTAFLGIAYARVVGINFLLSVFCLAWAADICAYFGGKAFGKRKLAPAISPAKSWEGVWSGMLGVLVLAVAWILADRAHDFGSASLYTHLWQRLGPIGLVIAAVFLAAMTVVGDLVESLVKRSAGAKDSSRLLPGHGGVLDRVDALLPLFPLALALISDLSLR